MLCGITHLHILRLVVPQINTVVRVIAWVACNLPSIHRNRLQKQAAIGVKGPAAVLPLHDGAGAVGGCGVGDGTVVGFFVVAIGGEGVGNARVVGFEEVVVYGVVEALRGLLACAGVSGDVFTTYRSCKDGAGFTCPRAWADQHVRV